MPRFPVAQSNPFRTKGKEVFYETEIWHCCRSWEVVLSSYTWNAADEMFKREEYWVRDCGICGEPPRPRLEDRIR